MSLGAQNNVEVLVTSPFKAPSGSTEHLRTSSTGGASGLHRLLLQVWSAARASAGDVASRKRWSTFAPHVAMAAKANTCTAAVLVPEQQAECSDIEHGSHALLIGPAQKYRPSKSGARIEIAKLGLAPVFIDAQLTRRITRNYAFEILGFSMANRDVVLAAISTEVESDGLLRATDIAFLRLDPQWIAKQGH